MYHAQHTEPDAPADDDRSPVKPHVDISPELKEVMHLLKMMEDGRGLKKS